MSQLPGPPLRIAVLGDFDGMHTRRWTEPFVQRGHEVHAISYYRPSTEMPGVTLHVLSGTVAPSAGGGGSGGASLASKLPPSLLRLAHALRYRRAGLRRVLEEIRPDVFHAHYLVEHGFYGSLAGFHPYVVGGWGSDVFVEAQKPLGRLVARWTAKRADLLVANDTAMLQELSHLGLDDAKLAAINLGVDPLFLEGEPRSVNLSEAAVLVPTILSDRALESLYNIDRVLRAFGLLHGQRPDARLLIAGDGSQRTDLETLAVELGLGESVRFLGRLDAAALKQALEQAQVYVSVPSSDSMAQSTLEAMAVGAFSVLSDLPSQHAWIEDGKNGLLVADQGPQALARVLQRALADSDLRRNAAMLNRGIVAARANRERNLLVLERHFYRLAGRVLADESAI